MWIRIPIGGQPKRKGQIFAKNAIKEREKMKNSLGLKATLLARLKPMISPTKLMPARVPQPKAPRLPHPHRLDPENQNPSQKARKKAEKIDSNFCCRSSENKPMFITFGMKKFLFCESTRVSERYLQSLYYVMCICKYSRLLSDFANTF